MRSPFAPKNTPLPTRPTPPLTSVSLSKNPTEKVSEDILLESAEIKTTPIWPATAASVEGPEDLESSGIFTITPLRMSPEEASRELDSQEMNVIRATASTQSPREDHAVVLPAVSPTPAPPAAPSAAEREILERQKKIREEADLFKKAEERIVKAIQVYCRSHPHLAVLEYFHDTHSNVTSVLKVANRVDMKEKEVKKIFQDFMIGGILRNVSNTVVHFAPSDEDAQAIKEIVTFWRNKRYHNQVLKWMATHGNG